jgi:hypothetical protein
LCEDVLGCDGGADRGEEGGVRRIFEHVGSAHDELELAVLMQTARDRVNAGQDELDLGLDTLADSPLRAHVVGVSSRVLWQVLRDAYRELGFEALGDEAFAAMFLARLIQPTSKAEAIGVLEDVGQVPPHLNTLYAALRRAQGRYYRDRLAEACLAYSARTSGTAAFLMHDCTVRHEALVVRVEVRGHHRGREPDRVRWRVQFVTRAGSPASVTA